MFGATLILVMVITGGLIAFIGDRIGTRVGKRRLTLWGLRPRYTSIIITILTGILIAGSTMVVLTIISYDVRTALFGMEALQQRTRELTGEVASRTQALAVARSELEAAQAELARLARDEEIARLNFRQAQLEWEAAEKQYELGTLEEGALNQVRLALRQAQLDYWEACHRHDLAKRRLSQGIAGDLLGGMSR